MIRALASVLVLAPGTPAAACHEIPPGLRFCAEGAVWQGAVRESHGNGADLVPGEAWLTVQAGYAGRTAGGAADDLAAQRDRAEAEDRPVLRDSIALPGLLAERSIGAEPDRTRARLIVEAAGRRVLLAVAAPVAQGVPGIDGVSRAAPAAPSAGCGGAAGGCASSVQH